MKNLRERLYHAKPDLRSQSVAEMVRLVTLRVNIAMIAGYRIESEIREKEAEPIRWTSQ